MRMSERAFRGYVILAVIFLALALTPLFAQVDRNELENLPPVVFINYEGPHAKIDTREQIRQIGVVLGRGISEREAGIQPILNGLSIERRREYTYKFEVGALSRYFVIHSVSGPQGDKLDADIFGLGVDAGVDHIRNLRWIVQGYLQDAYSYSERDAALLAEYITIYNAVYRGDWEYFSKRYKTPVISNLTEEKAGLSIRYDEWPGRTLMIIPLGHGGLSSIDTSAISDSRVVEEMRREDDQSVPQRQQMVDLKEREAEQAAQQARLEREKIREEERQIAAERQRVEEQRRRVEEERQAREQAAQTQQEREKARQEADSQTRELERKEAELQTREEELERRREEAQKYEDFVEQKIDETQKEREDIARDQQAIIIQENTGILGITIERVNPPMGRLVRFNPSTGSEIRRSPLDTVHTRTVTFIGGRTLAIAGENSGPGAVRLIEITPDTLIIARQGDNDIKTGSLLWVNSSDLYAITVDLSTNECHMARFDTNLVLQAKSAAKVHPESSVTIQQGRLLTQREDGSPLILNPATLVELY